VSRNTAESVLRRGSPEGVAVDVALGNLAQAVDLRSPDHEGRSVPVDPANPGENAHHVDQGNLEGRVPVDPGRVDHVRAPVAVEVGGKDPGNPKSPARLESSPIAVEAHGSGKFPAAKFLSKSIAENAQRSRPGNEGANF